MLSLVDSVKTLLILKLPSLHYKLTVVNRNEKEATFLIGFTPHHEKAFPKT
jgi:hypothetical protein